jgi:Fe-S cluster assembly iron-binding protein IscA
VGDMGDLKFDTTNTMKGLNINIVRGGCEGWKVQYSTTISAKTHNNNCSDGDFGCLPDQKWHILLHSRSF